jgi:hypothetical protein
MRRFGYHIARTPSLRQEDFMNINSRSGIIGLAGIIGLVGLVAIVSVGLDRDGSAHTLPSATSIECNSRDPLSPCATNVNFGYPVGDGMFVTLMEDFF